VECVLRSYSSLLSHWFASVHQAFHCHSSCSPSLSTYDFQQRIPGSYTGAEYPSPGGCGGRRIPSRTLRRFAMLSFACFNSLLRPELSIALFLARKSSRFMASLFSLSASLPTFLRYNGIVGYRRRALRRNVRDWLVLLTRKYLSG